MRTARRRVWLGLGVLAGFFVLLFALLHGGGAPAPQERRPLPSDASHAPALQTRSAPDGPEPEGADGPEGAQIAVRDLATGDPLAGIGIRFKGGDGVREVLSDDGGMLTLPAEAPAAAAVELASERWQLPSGYTIGSLRQEKTLWLYGLVSVRVRVTYARPPSDPRPPWITVRTVGPDVRTDADRQGRTPWQFGWSMSRGLDTLLNAFEFDAASETFSGTIPRVRYTVIGVGRAGFRRCLLDVPTQGDDEVDLVAFLEPAWALAGRLGDEEGNPVAGALLQVYVVVEGHRSHLNPSREALGVGWAAGLRTSRDEHAVVNLGSKVRLAEDGSFRIELPLVGRVVLVAHAPGRRPLWRDLGVVTGELADVDLRLPAPTPSSGRITFRVKSTILRHAMVHVSDITDRALQTTLRIDLDSEGSFPDTWFVRGREYWIIASGVGPDGSEISADGLIRWDGREVVDIDTLGVDLDAFRSR